MSPKNFSFQLHHTDARCAARRSTFFTPHGPVEMPAFMPIATQGSVKGLEISAYNCHACPGMALSFGTSPIGAAHKDAWIIAWEIANDRFSYNKSKVEKLIEFQRLRGGFFESATVCRLPWVEVSFGLQWYPEYLEAATGEKRTWEDLYQIGDRIYNLIRAFWKRENPGFGRKWDYPSDRWFEGLRSEWIPCQVVCAG